MGLHVPVLHELTHVGRAPRWDYLGVTLLLAGVAVAGLSMLLRAHAPATTPSRPDAPSGRGDR